MQSRVHSDTIHNTEKSLPACKGSKGISKLLKLWGKHSNPSSISTNRFKSAPKRCRKKNWLDFSLTAEFYFSHSNAHSCVFLLIPGNIAENKATPITLYFMKLLKSECFNFSKSCCYGLEKTPCLIIRVELYNT